MFCRALSGVGISTSSVTVVLMCRPGPLGASDALYFLTAVSLHPLKLHSVSDLFHLGLFVLIPYSKDGKQCHSGKGSVLILCSCDTLSGRYVSSLGHQITFLALWRHFRFCRDKFILLRSCWVEPCPRLQTPLGNHRIVFGSDMNDGSSCRSESFNHAWWQRKGNTVWSRIYKKWGDNGGDALCFQVQEGGRCVCTQ